MANGRRWKRNERGATLVLMAVVLVLLLAIMALGIDLSILYDSRGEAQRAADASALAGASAYLNYSPASAAVTAVHDRAMEYAARNAIRRTPIDTTSEVTLQIIPDSFRVRVTVRRAAVSTYFAKIFGIRSVPIGARAAAEASPAGVGKCLAPVAVPDAWNETNTSSGRGGQDLNGNRVWDPNESWVYEPLLGDTYTRWDPTIPGGPVQTGYGSDFRNSTGYTGDYGRPIVIKAQNPSQALTSGFFYPWRIGNSSGASDYRNNFTQCNPATVQIGDTVDIETGNMVGPTSQAINSVVALDPNAVWQNGAVVNSQFTNWLNSPRVITIGLFDPAQIAGIQGGGNLQLTFNNFALFWIEGMGGGGNQAPVLGRFLYFASGTGGLPGGTTGSLIRSLRLVE